MQVDRRGVLLGGAGLILRGCDGRSADAPPDFRPPPPLAALKLSENRLIRMTACVRPFRGAGPRVEAENIDGKRVIHNYGHGGSGWSLSWGCAAEVAALASGATSIAVIGAGAMGMTAALRLVETGATVTVYARELPAETRSARATGVWSPSSRIGLANRVSPTFSQRWEQWARAAFDTHQHYVGAVGEPVAFIPTYALRDEPRPPRTPASRDFLHLDRQVRDMVPTWSALAPEEHPFRADQAHLGLRMTFNVAAYADRLVRDFLLRGGRMVRRDFPQTADILALREPVIVNCTGYEARRLWGDDSVEPVRGQINWLAPQLDARYAVSYRDVSAVSRGDGVVVQYTGPNDDFGFGVDDETPD